MKDRICFFYKIKEGKLEDLNYAQLHTRLINLVKRLRINNHISMHYDVSYSVQYQDRDFEFCKQTLRIKFTSIYHML